MVKLFDIFAMIIILSSLFVIPYKKWAWLTYALGCGIYLVVFSYSHLFGAAFMNVVAIVISIKNYRVKNETKKT